MIRQDENGAALHGWTVLRVTATLIASGEACELIERLLIRIETERTNCT